jgi:hypothetical protein
MRKRTRVLVLILLTAAVGLLACAGWWWLTTPRHRIGLNSCSQIRQGMTQEEVEAILGVPPGNYATREELRLMGGLQMGRPANGEHGHYAEWASDELVIWVYFGPDGAAQLVGITDIGGRPPESLLERMRRWLGW